MEGETTMYATMPTLACVHICGSWDRSTWKMPTFWLQCWISWWVVTEFFSGITLFLFQCIGDFHAYGWMNTVPCQIFLKCSQQISPHPLLFHMNGGTVWGTVFQGSRLNGILCLISFFLFSLELQIAVYINLKCLFSYTISLIFTALILNINFKVNRYDIECALGFFFLFPHS